MTDTLLIEAGTVLLGLDAGGRMLTAENAGIRIANGLVAEIAPIDSFAASPLRRYGSPGMIAMPGLVNSHHHSGLTPIMVGVPFAPLELWLPQFRAMRGVGLRLDTLYSAIEMLESGTTTVHHIHGGLPADSDGWQATTDAVIGAYGEIGMRVSFSWMMRDRNILTYEDDGDFLANLPADLAAWMDRQIAARHTPTAEYMAFFKSSRANWQDRAPRHVRHNLAPANLHWCSDAALELMFDTARTAGANIHMHLVETERQAIFARERYGRSAIAHLHRLGVLGSNVTFGHGNWLDRDDLDILADCGCSICHNPSSGLRLGSGIAPVNEMRRRGIKVALGIDQSGLLDDRDMLVEMKLAWALHRETGLWNDRPDAARVLQMATEHGGLTAGFGAEVGRIEPGREADIVLLSHDAVARPWSAPETPIAELVLHRGRKSAVEQVFVGGRLVVDGGKAIAIDRDGVLTEIRQRLETPPSAAEVEARAMVTAIQPYLEAFNRKHTPSTSYLSYRYNLMNDA